MLFLLYLSSLAARVIGIYSLIAFFFKGPIHEPKWIWIVGIAGVAWLIVCSFVLVRNLLIFYLNLEDEDPVLLTSYFLGGDTSEEIMVNLFIVEAFILGIAITPGEGRRHKMGWDKHEETT